jgi:VanZ family protein
LCTNRLPLNVHFPHTRVLQRAGGAGVAGVPEPAGAGVTDDGMPAEPWRRAAHAAGWFCVALLAVLSLLPADEMVVRTGFGGRIEHALAYAGTALLLGLARRGPGRPAACLAAYAACLELLQRFSPGRSPAFSDWMVGSAGVLAGVGAPGTVAGLIDHWVEHGRLPDHMRLAPRTGE